MWIKTHNTLARTKRYDISYVVARVKSESVLAYFGVVVSFHALSDAGDGLEVFFSENRGVVNEKGWTLEFPKARV